MKSTISENIRRSCYLSISSLIKILPVLSLLFIPAVCPNSTANAQHEAPKDADRTVKRFDQWRLAQTETKVKQEKFQFDRREEDMTEGDVRSMLLKNNFYASCWTYNRDFCNPEGDFENAFIDNGDDTVTDTATGLMWQKSGSPAVMTWEDAGRYVQQLNRQRFGRSSPKCRWQNREEGHPSQHRL